MRSKFFAEKEAWDMIAMLFEKHGRNPKKYYYKIPEKQKVIFLGRGICLCLSDFYFDFGLISERTFNNMKMKIRKYAKNNKISYGEYFFPPLPKYASKRAKICRNLANNNFEKVK